MSYPLRSPANRARAHWSSSISQCQGALAVIRRGEIVPIAFDVIDYVKYDPIDHCCREVASHKAILVPEQARNYDHPTATCTYWSDTYVTGEMAETVLEELPTFSGDGMVKRFINDTYLVNDDLGRSLGTRDKIVYRVGLAYASGSKTVPAAKRVTRP